MCLRDPELPIVQAAYNIQPKEKGELQLCKGDFITVLEGLTRIGGGGCAMRI